MESGGVMGLVSVEAAVRSRGIWMGIALALAVAAGASRGAEEPDAPPQVELERLLELPSSLELGGERRGGAGPDEWKRRFAEVRGEVDEAQLALQNAQDELEHTAVDSSQWQVAAPGTAEPQNSPLSYRLREEIRAQRAEVARAEKRLRDLEVEADLAGVPEAWRRPPEDARDDTP